MLCRLPHPQILSVVAVVTALAHSASSGGPPAVRNMHLSGITAEDRPGGEENPRPPAKKLHSVAASETESWRALRGAGEGI
jgi:hypothetical protein